MTRKRASLTQALLESVFASFRDALLQFVRAAATEPPAACPSIPCWTFSHPNWSGALRTVGTLRYTKAAAGVLVNTHCGKMFTVLGRPCSGAAVPRL